MSRPDFDELLDFAGGLAETAAHISIAGFGRAKVMRKADDSDVTTSDIEIQHMIEERIAARYPDHAVLGEEGGDDSSGTADPPGGGFCWVIDPIDGTRNYARGFPEFSTSIALLEDGLPILGVVNNHLTGWTYSAARGRGAHLDGRPMHVSDMPFGGRTIVTFQPASDGRTFQQAAWVTGVVLRNTGSTALHLARLADGNVDGALAMECHLWDVAAGGLMVEEAGGAITDLAGRPLFPIDIAAVARGYTPFIAGSPATHPHLLGGMRP